MHGQQLIDYSRANKGGFLNEKDLQTIAADPATRLSQVIVRCGGGRFQCAAQDVQHFVRIIEEHASRPDAVGDYVRDVSLPAVRP